MCMLQCTLMHNFAALSHANDKGCMLFNLICPFMSAVML